MAVKLDLRIRDTGVVVSVRMEQLERIFDLPSGKKKDALWRMFENMAGVQSGRSDVEWLNMIVNHTPEGGLSVSELSKRFRVAKRIADLDPEKEGVFTLSDYQADVLWGIMNDDDFKLRSLDPSFAAFMLMFMEAGGYQFSDMKDDPEGDELDREDGDVDEMIEQALGEKVGGRVDA